YPPFALKDRLLKCWPELQIGVMQAVGSPQPSSCLPQTKLSRNSNQIAGRRIRRFESNMPSHAVRSPPRGMLRSESEVEPNLGGRVEVSRVPCRRTAASDAVSPAVAIQLSRWIEEFKARPRCLRNLTHGLFGGRAM